MDPNSLLLDISSDEDAGWNDHGKGVSDGGDDYNWYAELFGEGNKEVEVDDDCVVLDKDPNQPVEVRNDNGDDDSDDVLVVSEKGQVACRDYPHSRHLCIKFPFATTPNQSHCNQCYCYVCDSVAPCSYWGNGTATTDHCHATDKDEFWILERKNTKNVQPVPRLAPLPLPRNQIPNLAPIPTSANFQYPNIPSQFGNNLLASRTKLHPDLASQVVLKAHQKNNLNSRVHRPALKRTSSVNQNPYRGNFGNQTYQVNGMVSRSSRSVQASAVKTCVSQTPPLLPQPQVPLHTNPSFMPHVNSNHPFPQTMSYHQSHLVPPLPGYMLPAPPSYPVPSKTTPVSDFNPHSSQGQGSIAGSGLGWGGGQDFATVDCTNNSSLGGGLGDYRYDIFDEQPIEPGFTDYSSDSAFIDPGPIFNFHL